MYRPPRFSRFLSIALVAAVSGFGLITAAFSLVAKTITGFALRVFRGPDRIEAAAQPMQRITIAAVQYLQRQVRRERPRVCEGWRMCPSC